MQMPTGVVKNFNALKGYGMVVPDDGGKDAIAFGPDFFKSVVKGVADGKKVSYDITVIKGKPAATNIKLK
jgi:CspA family cold shock protein